MQVLVCLANIFVQNSVPGAQFIANLLSNNLTGSQIFDILDADIHGGTGVMGRPFAMLVGIVPAGDYRAIIVVLEHLVIDRGHDIYGGISLNPPSMQARQP